MSVSSPVRLRQQVRFLQRQFLQEGDGTTVTMADTSANQKAYPQISTQRAGMGSPIARVGAIISLSCGAIVGLGVCRYAGKGQGEVSLLRKLWDILSPGDVLLGDRLMANWTNVAMLQQRGLDLVSRLNKANRKADFRKGKRLGKDDHIVRWKKPSSIRSVDRETYQSLPEFVTIRETRIRVKTRGFSWTAPLCLKLARLSCCTVESCDETDVFCDRSERFHRKS